MSCPVKALYLKRSSTLLVKYKFGPLHAFAANVDNRASRASGRGCGLRFEISVATHFPKKKSIKKSISRKKSIKKSIFQVKKISARAYGARIKKQYNVPYFIQNRTFLLYPVKIFLVKTTPVKMAQNLATQVKLAPVKLRT